MKKLVVFDLDGTLFDSAQGLTDSLNTVLENAGLDKISADETKRFAGKGTKYLVARATKSSGEKAEEYHRQFLEDYDKRAIDETKLCPGVDRLLKRLNSMDIKIAILTNKPQETAEKTCEKLLKDYRIDYIRGSMQGLPLKPDTAGIEEILTRFNMKHEDIVMVGDSETDVETSINAGVDFIGILWGFRTKRQIKEAGATSFARTADILLNMILYRFGKKKVTRMIGEFKKFITKGNVLDMAVGVIIGAAFSAIVNSLVKDVITPIISLVTGDVSLTELHWILKPEVLDAEGAVTSPAVTLNYGSFIQAIINFLLIALTVFFFIKLLVTVRKKLDYNENMRETIQEKLDFDEPLNKMEKRWMKRMKKTDRDHVPRKTQPAPPPAPPAPPEPALTDKLLAEILEEIKKQKA